MLHVQLLFPLETRKKAVPWYGTASAVNSSAELPGWATPAQMSLTEYVPLPWKPISTNVKVMSAAGPVVGIVCGFSGSGWPLL